MRSLVFIVLVACGGGSGLTDLEGVYTVDTWTRNEASCDVEGASIKDNNEPHFFIKGESFFGEEFVNVNQCPTVGECQTDARDDGTLHIGQWGFQDGSDSDGWTDESAFAFNVQGTCEATRQNTIMTSDGDTVRIEERTFLGTFAPDAAGDCDDEAAALAATASSPCDAFEAMTATFTAEF